MRLAAGYHLGLQIRRISRDSFQAYLNVSNHSVERHEQEDKPLPPQPENGEPFRVLGHNDGKMFYVLQGSSKILKLRAADHTPTNLLRLAPLGY